MAFRKLDILVSRYELAIVVGWRFINRSLELHPNTKSLVFDIFYSVILLVSMSNQFSMSNYLNSDSDGQAIERERERERERTGEKGLGVI